MPTDFTPLQSLAGGGLIGLASVLLMLVAGRIMGATGILAGVLPPVQDQDWQWRAVLLAGMAIAPFLYLAATGGFPAIDVPVSTPMLMVGGFLVGVGVTFGGGCTSGHGVCGISRLNLRGIVATLVYIAAGALMVVVFRSAIGGL